MSTDPNNIREVHRSEGLVPPPPPDTPVVPVAAPVAPAGDVVIARHATTRRLYPDAIVAAVVGLVMLVVGLLVIVRAGLGGDLREPVVNVIGFSHTAILGLVEVALGVMLLVSGATSSRSGAIFFGAVAGIGGFIGAVQTESFVKPLALETSMAWWVCIAGAVVALTALIVPRSYSRTTEVRAI
jgi:hypothetical protein